MSIYERKQIAFDAGRLAAWRGVTHKPSGLESSPPLHAEWQRGVAVQCDIMRDEAAKIPLVFKNR